MSAIDVTKVTPLRAWILASRPSTLPAAAVPVVVGTAVAFGEAGVFRPSVFLLTLVCALAIQIGTNFANDYSDFHRGADTEHRLGPIRVTQSGLMSESAVRTGIIAAFSFATLLGLALAWIGGWPIIAIGVFSILSGLAYTGGPFPLGYHGLGDVFVFVFFGLIAVTGTTFLQTGTWSSLAVLTAVPVGLIVTNILVVNNLRDIQTDRTAGKRTLAVRMGARATRLQYAFFMAAAYAIPVTIAALDTNRRFLALPLLTLPLGVGLVRKVMSGVQGRDLNPILARTGLLLLQFGLLLAAGVAVRPR